MYTTVSVVSTLHDTSESRNVRDKSRYSHNAVTYTADRGKDVPDGIDDAEKVRRLVS